MNILAIDGGGMRGAIVAMMLERFEAVRDRPTIASFGLLAGTSTGALIAGALAAGISAAEVREMFFARGPRIFKRRLRTYFGIRGARYEIAALRDAIGSVVGQRTLGECVLPFACCAIRLGPVEGRVFRSWHEPHKSIMLADALAASAAAPTYFDPVEIGGVRHIDGGLAKNLPARIALDCVLANNFHYGKPIRLVSLATGPSEFTHGPSGSGAIHWASDIVNTCIEGGMSFDEYSVRQHLGKSFLRVVPSLGHASRRMDDASESNLSALWEAGANAAGLADDMSEWLAR